MLRSAAACKGLVISHFTKERVMKSAEPDYGVLDPATTQVLEFPDGFHRLLRGEKGGRMNWPYPPEVLQRRNNQFRAALGILVVPNIMKLGMRSDFEACCQDFARTPGGAPADFFDFCMAMEMKGVDVFYGLEFFLVKMKRPGAPQGVEWNAPGGIAKLGEKVGETHLREIREETSGTSVIASSLLLRNTQYASGCYREWYDLYACLAPFAGGITSEEGALEWTTVPLASGQLQFERWAAVPPEDPACCWVDGKVILGAELICSRLEQRRK